MNAAEIVGLATLLLSFWLAHASNKGRQERTIHKQAELETKVNLMYDWYLKQMKPPESN